ncbi:hypothetical protein [Candidatus Methylomirabilis sp.]|uniref:DUF3368 domain-containing protein n=1 Tax=Candidatus Methylomirabilis tolerans TaxID=3123416 RepID=A0AAJ1AJW6_9BACT|nr:hypothetical protein [Candidatus Methylomirabilis sp.]
MMGRSWSWPTRAFWLTSLPSDRMDILHQLRGYAFRIPNHVVAEVEYEDQKKRLHDAFAEGTLSEIEITDIAEIALYAELRRVLGDGESACLAVAATRRWVMAGDEKGRLRREVMERLGEGYLLNTPGAIVEALRAGILTVSEAEEIRMELARRRFVMSDVPPFEELL